MNRFYLLLWVLLVAACGGTKELYVKDQQALSMINQGKNLIATEQYAKAATVLEQASMRPPNQATTTALYLSGLAYYYQGSAFPAEQQFDKLLNSYPETKYAPEAKYHRALLMLNKYDDKLKREGLNTLIQLSEKGRDASLRKDATDAAKDFLFYQTRYDFLEVLRPQVVQSWKVTVVEAMVYQKLKAKDKKEAETLYAQHLSLGGSNSEFVDLLLKTPEKIKEVHEPEIMKVGLFLPMHFDDYSFFALNSIPNRSKAGLEFFEGFQKAIEDYSLIANKKIFVQMYDSRRDPKRIREQLTELNKYAPDLVVGDVYTDASLAISEWCREKEIPHIVPFSANPVLVKDSATQSFLSRPAVGTHGHRMAEYASSYFGLTNVVVWTDGRRFTQMIAQSFTETFQSLGGSVQMLVIDSVYEERAQEDILDHFERSIDSWEEIDGVYIPVSNQESAGLILSSMAIELKDQPMRVMGTPNWEDFKLITQKEKETFQLTFTSPFSAYHDSITYSRFYSHYFREFNTPPAEESIQGYGLGRYLLKMLDDYDYKNGTLDEFIRNYEIYRALHTNFYFDGKQDNQYLNIMEYREGGVVQIN